MLGSVNSAYANTKDEEDRIEGYEDGMKWGELAGYIAGEKDRVNSRRSNWEQAYKEEAKDIVKEYNLDKQSYAYRSKFRERFEEGFKIGYLDAYRGYASDNKASATIIGEEMGRYFGELLGANHGRNDYYNNLKSDWKRNLPTETNIIDEYKLRNDTKEYSDAFLKAFKIGYEEEYLYSYRITNYEIQSAPNQAALNLGKEEGQVAGEAYAMMDYIQGKSNNWLRSFNELELQNSLLNRYELFREELQYKVGFINGFKDGFQSAYTAYYQGFNAEVGERNINYKIMSMHEDMIEFEDRMVHFIHGEENVEKNITAQLYVPAGTFYTETYVALQKEEMSSAINNETLIPVTKIYDMKVINNVNSLQLRKPLTLTFKYYGSYRGGIYQLIDSKWRYVYSEIEDGVIKTEIPSGFYNGGRYAVFIDEDYVELMDIHTHWANRELYTFLRRGYIQGDKDKKYNPDQSMTRGELLLLLSKIQGWNTSNDTRNADKFEDFNNFGIYTKTIDYAVSKGYIDGYDDKSFKPNNPITYIELEEIMKKILDNDNFAWETIAEKMLYERYARSNSRLGKDKFATKGEVVYMLHELIK